MCAPGADLGSLTRLNVGVNPWQEYGGLLRLVPGLPSTCPRDLPWGSNLDFLSDNLYEG
jgi:hypothetical protein